MNAFKDGISLPKVKESSDKIVQAIVNIINGVHVTKRFK